MNITYEQLLELVADEEANHWLLRAGGDEDLAELLETGSITVHIAGRHFVVALVIQEVDANGQAKE